MDSGREAMSSGWQGWLPFACIVEFYLSDTLSDKQAILDSTEGIHILTYLWYASSKDFLGHKSVWINVVTIDISEVAMKFLIKRLL